ncbi:MAG: plasma-membrane proton-efflux P-type ATPase [Candidatus Odinarchaeota archaeon]
MIHTCLETISSEVSDEDACKILDSLSTSRNGLTTSEANEKLKEYGPNEIPEKKKNPFINFLKNFWGPIPWMIEAAVIMSAIDQQWDDFWIIFSLLMINAVIRFWEEKKADNAIELLKQRLAINARVLRDKKWIVLPARELVIGDIIRVRLGDIVPADIRLISGDYLIVDESVLTGESLPVEKHLMDEEYAGAIIKQGEMDAVVTKTGIHTFFGKTTKLVGESKTKSHFQKAILKIGNYLITLAIIIVLITFIIATIRHESILQTLQFALILTVSGIPAALPAVLSVTMAIGAIALAKKEAIVSKLVAIEELASTDILCSDKTGTITKNELTIREIVPFSDFTNNDVLLYATLASKEENQDPIDNVIINELWKSISQNIVSDNYKVTAFQPFDPIKKRTEATVETVCNLPDSNKIQDYSCFKVAKGAPQVILSLIKEINDINYVNNYVEIFATKGYRALGVAKTDLEDKWQLVGLIALYDPPREDSAETIKTAQSMGIQVKMITGDHVAIAKETAKQINLGTNIITADSYLEKMNSEAEHNVEEADGFAQFFPEHKYHMVELLQKSGHIVAMTGDGVNDAPALKKADVGIAVAGATDAAKSAADIVLTKPGISVTIDAIKESRKIFQRMTNYATYRIAETIRILFFIALSIIFFQFYPVTALMIVLLAILNDIPIMTISYDRVKYQNKPQTWNMKSLLFVASYLGFIGVGSSFLFLYIGLVIFHLNPILLQSFIYLKLSVAGHLTIFVARTRGPFWSIRPPKILLFAILITQLIATIITVYGFLLPALGWGFAIFVWLYSISLFLATDFFKVRLYKYYDKVGKNKK